MPQRIGTYYYFLPTYNQGRKVIWDGIDRDGMKFLDHFPEEIIQSKNNTEMKILTKFGSLFQIIGTDNYDAIRGTNPIGCVFSEYPWQNPVVWEIVRPILRENKGWAIFLYTPQGHNHGYQLLEMAKRNKDKWFSQVLTVDDTKVITREEINQERVEGMPENLLQQEYYCSFEAAAVGAYYGDQMRQARNDKRITKVPYQQEAEVHTWWDLGIGDATAIGFFQQIGLEWHLIDYYEASGEGLAHYAQVLKDKKYNYGNHYAPHDIDVRELGSGKSRLEIAKTLGIEFQIVPKLSIDDGINAARIRFNTLWIDEEKCQRFTDAISLYRKEYNEKMGEYKPRPLHDWTSHAADMLRYWAVTKFEKEEPLIPFRPSTPYGGRKH